MAGLTDTKEAGEHLDDAGKIRLREKVIEASLKAAADAQDHLLSMRMPRSKGPEPGPLQSPGPGWPGHGRQPITSRLSPASSYLPCRLTATAESLSVTTATHAGPRNCRMSRH